MRISDITQLRSNLDLLLQEIPYLKMLVLFGSRARGDTHAKSDWDFAALYDEELRQQTVEGFGWFRDAGILGDCFGISSDNIDLVELDRCSDLIAHYIARDGQVIYEREPGLFAAFRDRALMSEGQLREFCQNMTRKLEDSLQRRGL
ncbi:type VII toxin-antitoxin system MntA family adenylyltransferase antitoxin [Baaleninema simplex]|uniref:type VII toxin-antitoxin system MntA family adenylyltransferase antitoxin n=1 Tax=Baaleninema simplex TaxID=2862350 RepID=UPI0003461519|nr:nucleotidyltransferase domain-containing protein [Baaleninema simplex]